MATYTETWRNKLLLAWFIMQVPIITFIDGYNHLFPSWTYETPGAPLHALAIFRKWFIETYNDPIVQWSLESNTGHDSWMGLFLYIEFGLTLPLVLYGVCRLGIQRKGTSGVDELLFLIYGFEVALTTLVCFYDVFYWDNDVYSPELKRTFQYSFYAPYILTPALIFVDMFFRILGRIRVADAAIAGKKGQ